jgi:hypothetical protein
MKKLLLLFLFIGLFYGCARPPEIEYIQSQINLMKKNKNSYVSEVLQDSLVSINKEINFQKSKFVLFRSFKKANDRLNNLNEDIKDGKYKPENFKIDQGYLDKQLSIETEGEIKYRKLETGDFPALIYIVNIDGKEYIYSFRVYSNDFIVTPK